MVISELYTSTSGTSSDAYDLADAIDSFLVGSLGWSRQYTIASGTYNRDIVYTNSGGESGNPYDTIYYRLEAISGTLFNHVYSYYASDGGSYSGHITGYANTSNSGAVLSPSDYRIIGNKNVVWVLVTNASGSAFSSSVGYCDSYYSPSDDSYPVCLVGTADEEHDFSYDRVLMYDHNSDQGYYNAENYSWLVRYGSKQARDDTYFGMSVALMNSAAGTMEMRGELRGIKQVYGEEFFSGDLLTTSGTSVSGTFCVVKYGDSDSNTFLYGPYEEVV